VARGGTGRLTLERGPLGTRRAPDPKVAGLAFQWVSACYRDLEEEDEAKAPTYYQTDSRGRMIGD
jgi:hypothetical protein